MRYLVLYITDVLFLHPSTNLNRIGMLGRRSVLVTVVAGILLQERGSVLRYLAVPIVYGFSAYICLYTVEHILGDPGATNLTDAAQHKASGLQTQ